MLLNVILFIAFHYYRKKLSIPLNKKNSLNRLHFHVAVKSTIAKGIEWVFTFCSLSILFLLGANLLDKMNKKSSNFKDSFFVYFFVYKNYKIGSFNLEIADSIDHIHHMDVFSIHRCHQL